MKKLVFTTALLALPGLTFAKSPVNGHIEDIYVNEIISVPTNNRMCYDVPVPIYERQRESGNAGGGALLGMIVGGLLGKGITNDDGGAAAGAVIGGIYGADRGANKTRDVIVGYNVETKCDGHVLYEEKTIKSYSHSILTYIDENGKKQTIRFVK